MEISFISWEFSPGQSIEITPFNTCWLDNWGISEILKHSSTDQGYDVSIGSWQSYTEMVWLWHSVYLLMSSLFPIW